jgi:hypothetical protein
VKSHAKLAEIAHTAGQQICGSYPNLGLIIVTFNQTPHTPVAMTGQAPNKEYAIRMLRQIADSLEKSEGNALILPH